MARTEKLIWGLRPRSGRRLISCAGMIPNPDNNPDKVSGFTRHRAVVKFRQISRHVGGILQSTGRSLGHLAIYPAKMAGSLSGHLPGHFVRIALPFQSSRQFSRHSVVSEKRKVRQQQSGETPEMVAANSSGVSSDSARQAQHDNLNAALLPELLSGAVRVNS